MVTRERVSSQEKAVVNCQFTINLGTNFPLIKYRPLYIIWHLPPRSFKNLLVSDTRLSSRDRELVSDWSIELV